MTNLLPLEKLFKRKAKKKEDFPRLDVDYATLYLGLLNHLRANIYPLIDTGLAANSKIPGYYTVHNGNHFDEVVHYAGLLIGVEKGNEKIDLSAYEIYILLVAIRIHDIGNMYGREDHERKCFPILRGFGSASGDDDTEKKIIADIAQAHGGRTDTGSKDTISELETSKHVLKNVIRPQLIASIVRFADEICENRCRAARHLLDQSKLPKHSELFHKYAAAISANVVSHKDKRLILEYKVNIEDISKPWGCATEGDKIEAYLIDEILERLEKMDKERRYCNRFSKSIYTIDSIRAKIEIINPNKDNKVVKIISVPELLDFGYPDDNESHLKDKLKEYCGPGLYKNLTQKSDEES